MSDVTIVVSYDDTARRMASYESRCGHPVQSCGGLFGSSSPSIDTDSGISIPNAVRTILGVNSPVSGTAPSMRPAISTSGGMIPRSIRST
jgi:hypothetical protein